jgi:hypothetical protein
MTYRSGIALAAVACTCSLLTWKPTTADEPRKVAPALKKDVALEAMRREAEAKRQERATFFARMRGLGAPNVVEIKVLPAIQQNMVIQQRMKRVALNAITFEFVEIADPRAVVALDDLDDELEDGVFAPAQLPPRRRVVVASGSFERTLFGTSAGSKEERARLEGILTRKIEDAERNFKISPEQKKKLRLAGHGDISRFLDRVARENRRFEATRFDVAQCQNLLFHLFPLQNDFLEGPFQADSLFQKILGKVVEADWKKRRGSM